MRRTLPILLAALTLLVTACRGESVTRLRISPEGTATVISEFAFDDEALAIIGDLDDTPEEVLRALSEFIDPEALPVAAVGVEPEQFQRGGLHGIRVTIPGLDPHEVATELASGDSILDDVVLTLEDGILLMEGRTRDVPDFERARLLSLVPGDLSQILSLVLQVEVPGSVSVHNADRVLADGVLEWDLLPAIIDGEDVFVAVEAEVEPGFQFVDLEGQPFLPTEAAPTDDGNAWWVAVLPFLLAGAMSWLIISRLRKRSALPEIEGFVPRD
ncbi:MAG: hypothetical protein ACR2OI_10565 [Acidimicrobiia bacterium]